MVDFYSTMRQYMMLLITFISLYESIISVIIFSGTFLPNLEKYFAAGAIKIRLIIHTQNSTTKPKRFNVSLMNIEPSLVKFNNLNHQFNPSIHLSRWSCKLFTIVTQSNSSDKS